MMSMCMRYMSDREIAARIVNDGFLKIFSRIDTFENKGSFEGWMRRIIFRCLSDTLRKESTYLKFLVFEDKDAGYKSEALSRLYEEDLLKLVDQIPSASAEVFLLYAVEGFSHKEIASKKNISIGTSKWHLSDARKKLRDLIRKTDTSTNAG